MNKLIIKTWTYVYCLLTHDITYTLELRTNRLRHFMDQSIPFKSITIVYKSCASSCFQRDHSLFAFNVIFITDIFKSKTDSKRQLYH